MVGIERKARRDTYVEDKIDYSEFSKIKEPISSDKFDQKLDKIRKRLNRKEQSVYSQI